MSWSLKKMIVISAISGKKSILLLYNDVVNLFNNIVC